MCSPVTVTAAPPPAHPAAGVPDETWDRFLRSCPAGHPSQSSAWGNLKAIAGWNAERLTVERDNRIVAGVQLLLRPMWPGWVAYVPRGPVFANADADAAAELFAAMERLLRERGVRYCAVQPAEDSEPVLAALRAHGFRRSLSDISPSATTVVDLRPAEDRLLAGMSYKTRHNVRAGLRSDLEFRDVGAEGVEVFHRLLAQTSKRQSFHILSAAYLRKLVEEFDSRECCKLFLVYSGSEPVSGLLAVGFGDTLYLKRAAWSGARGSSKPNNFLHWSAMRWAKAHGYRRYDFEGIDRNLAVDILRGAQVRSEGVTRFKLGFGGAVELEPLTYETVRPRILFPPSRVLLWVAKQVGLSERAVLNVRRA